MNLQLTTGSIRRRLFLQLAAIAAFIEQQETAP